MSEFDNDEITWGKVAKGSYKGQVSYLSFFYQGEEYELYDVVYLNDASAPEPHIGKIIALWEDQGNKDKRMLIQWFFRSKDLMSLGLKLDSQELFLAFGEGKGVRNENDVEVILGKCKVLCTSENPRNIQPSEKDLRDADFFFYRVYNVERRHILDVDEVADKIGFKVVFNKDAWVSSAIRKSSKESNSTHVAVKIEENLVSSLPLTETVKVPDVPKISKESETSKVIDDGNTGVQEKSLITPNKIGQPLAGSSSSGLKKRPRDSDVNTDATKKKLDAESPSLKKEDELAGIKRPSVAKEDGKGVKKLKVAEKAKTLAPKLPQKGTDVKKPKVSVKTSIGIQDDKDLKTQKEETKNLTPKGVSTEPGTPPLPVADGSSVVIKQENEQSLEITQDGTQDDSNSKEANKLNADIHVDENIKLPSMEDTLGDIAPKSLTDPEKGTKLLPLEAERHLKSSGMTVKSATAVQRGESSSKPIKGMDRSDSISAVSGSLQSKVGTETRDAAKTAGPQERPEAKVTTKSLKAIPKTREGVTEGSRKGDTKHNSLSKSFDISVTKEEEIKKKIVDHKPKVVASNITKKVKPNLNAVEDKTQKSSEPLASKNLLNSSATKRASFSNETELKVSERTDFLKSKEDKGPIKNSASVVSTERRRIFKQLPWDESLLQGLPQGRVLRVFNVNPLFTSLDICDMLKSIFDGCSDARMIPHNNMSPYGEALVIFDNRKYAESAFRDIEEKCLVLTGSNRPLIASLAKPPETSRVTRFPGHIQIEKFKHMQLKEMQSEDMRKAVSTSHCSQPNTIEFEMAMEWRLHQEVAEKCWNDLYQKQNDEISKALDKRVLPKSSKSRL